MLFIARSRCLFKILHVFIDGHLLQDKDDRQEDKESLNANEEDFNEQADVAEEDVQQESANSADADDAGNASETEEVDDNDKVIF